MQKTALGTDLANALSRRLHQRRNNELSERSHALHTEFRSR